MSQIPRPALILGLAGLLPFVAGALGVLVPALAEIGRQFVSPHFSYRVLLGQYGVVILAFMSGVIWGFATRAEGRIERAGYVLAVIPALWAFVAAFFDLRPSLLVLAAGFVGLLAIDRSMWKLGLAPPWWMRLRLMLTSVAVACLGIGALA